MEPDTNLQETNVFGNNTWFNKQEKGKFVIFSITLYFTSKLTGLQVSV